MAGAAASAVTATMQVTTTERATYVGIRPHCQCGSATSVAATLRLAATGTFLTVLASDSVPPVTLPWSRLKSGTISCNIAGATRDIPTSGVRPGRSISKASARHPAMVWQTTLRLRRTVGGPFWSSQPPNPPHLAPYTVLPVSKRVPKPLASAAPCVMATLQTW